MKMENAQKLGVKVILHVIMHGIQYISEVDEDFEEELMDFEESVIQWEIGGLDKIYAYFETKNGHATAVMDVKHENPTLNIAIPIIDNAIDILIGKIPGAKAYMKGLIKVDGDLNYIQKFTMAIATIQQYLLVLKG